MLTETAKRLSASELFVIDYLTNGHGQHSGKGS
jgi:hypothetical protein